MSESSYSLFQTVPLPGTPLAERMRPKLIDEVVGQEKIKRQLSQYLESGFLPNMIFWGPPGTGKTTVAEALGRQFQAQMISVNATSSGAKELRQIGEEARLRRLDQHSRTLLFVDEIHRFNKAQQDVLLPYIEKGDLVLIGATTENPSYELNKAILSRCRLLIFERLNQSELKSIFKKSLSLEGKEISIDSFSEEALQLLFEWSDGDARKLLTVVEELKSVFITKTKSFEQQRTLTKDFMKEILGQLTLGHDKSSDMHYDLISAMIKSIRGSDVNAGLYYLARLLKGGEDPIFIARRLVILASEDVGNADPRALSVAIAGAQAIEFIGLPEGAINLAQVVTYLASAPKSNRSYMGLKKAQEYIEKTGSLPVPSHLKSKNQNYKYPHDYPRNWVSQKYLPEDAQSLKDDSAFYEPADSGYEKKIKEYLDWLTK